MDEKFELACFQIITYVGTAMYGTSVFADYPYIPKDDSNGKS